VLVKVKAANDSQPMEGRVEMAKGAKKKGAKKKKK